MHKKTVLLFLLIVFFVLIEFNTTYAVTSLTVYTDRSAYEYGDYLSIIFEVSELTSESLTFQIIDESGKQSQPITIPITKLKTEITAPGQFDPTVFPAGTYHISVEYSGAKSSTSFVLMDSEKLVIPSWIKNLGKWWSEGSIGDKDFALGIEYLMKEKIIIIPESVNQEEIHDTKIPQWVKNNAGWWADGLISDHDFASGIQYLVKIGAIVV